MACLTCNKILGFELRTLALICGYLYMIGKFIIVCYFALSLISMVHALSTIISWSLESKYEYLVNRLIILVYVGLQCVLYTVDSVLGIVGVVGVHAREVSKLKVFYWCAFITLILSSLMLLYLMSRYYDTYTGESWRILALEFLFHRVLSLICILVIRSYSYKLKMNPEETPPIGDSEVGFTAHKLNNNDRSKTEKTYI